MFNSKNDRCWQERLFGERLYRCSDEDDVATKDCLTGTHVTGVYFSFANIGADDVTESVARLYDHLNGTAKGRVFEVVQVVLWANNDVFGDDDFEKSHRECTTGTPWYAVPFSQTELKTRLSRRYRIKSGVPALVLLDSEGVTITSSGKERLVEDPLGSQFPWRPRPVDEVLKDVCLQTGRPYAKDHPLRNDREIRYKDLPSGTVRGFYFSAHWCPPCRAFTPQLVDAYRNIRRKEPDFEILFVSSDRSFESYSVYLDAMPWPAIPWQQANVRAELSQFYGVRGIPTLLLVDGNGHVITHDARTELAEDPLAENFPWKPRSVNILTERYATKLHDYPAVVLFVEGEESERQFAESVLTPVADDYYKRHNINFNAPYEDFLLTCEDDNYVQFLIAHDSDTSDILRDFVGLDDVVPLLVILDIPRRRFVVMKYGVEITSESVGSFVEQFKRGDLEFRDISERGNRSGADGQ